MECDYVIGVFTRGRVGTQYFLESLPEMILGVITIFCHPGEREAHLTRWSGKIADVVEYGEGCTNLGEARDWLMSYCRARGIKYAVQIDDNVLFAARAARGGKVEWSNKLLNIRNNFTSDDQTRIYVSMFQWMLGALRGGYGFCGVSHRSGNNRKSSPTEENTRLFAVWGISVEKYWRVGARFADNPFKEDFHMQLAFLSSGIKTICNNCYTFDKARGANATGGCSIYRNLTNVNRGSELLKQYYPDFVSLVEKTNDNWSNLEGADKRLEVVVHWKKAFDSSQR